MRPASDSIVIYSTTDAQCAAQSRRFRHPQRHQPAPRTAPDQYCRRRPQLRWAVGAPDGTQRHHLRGRRHPELPVRATFGEGRRRVSAVPHQQLPPGRRQRSRFPSVAAFLADTANSFSMTLGSQSSAIAQGAFGLFVQDNYKMAAEPDPGTRPALRLEPDARASATAASSSSTASASLVRLGHGRRHLPPEQQKFPAAARLRLGPVPERKDLRARRLRDPGGPTHDQRGHRNSRKPAAGLSPLVVTGAIRSRTQSTSRRPQALRPTPWTRVP